MTLPRMAETDVGLMEEALHYVALRLIATSDVEIDTPKWSESEWATVRTVC